MVTGKAYWFFRCNKPKEIIQEELDKILVNIGPNRDLELILNGHSRLADYPEIRRFMPWLARRRFEKKLNANRINYSVEERKVNASNDLTSRELTAIMTKLVSGLDRDYNFTQYFLYKMDYGKRFVRGEMTLNFQKPYI